MNASTAQLAQRAQTATQSCADCSTGSFWPQAGRIDEGDNIILPKTTGQSMKLNASGRESNRGHSKILSGTYFKDSAGCADDHRRFEELLESCICRDTGDHQPRLLCTMFAQAATLCAISQLSTGSHAVDAQPVGKLRPSLMRQFCPESSNHKRRSHWSKLTSEQEYCITAAR